MYSEIIENLSEKEIENLYENILEFEDNTHLAGCCCCSTGHPTLTGRACDSWCASRGIRYAGWYSYGGAETYFCYWSYINDWCTKGVGGPFIDW